MHHMPASTLWLKEQTFLSVVATLLSTAFRLGSRRGTT